jgi:hypothetical protein
MRARAFGVMTWAPPLVHHFEVRGAGRATNYMGPDRCAAFRALADLYPEIADHPDGARFVPELLDQAQDLCAWMVREDPLRAAMYRAAARELYDTVGATPGGAA